MKIRALDNNWVDGNYLGNKFQAKIYTEPSKYGINGGRVSKLWVLGPILEYDRGWSLGEEKREFWEPLVAALEEFAQTETFKNSLEAVRS